MNDFKKWYQVLELEPGASIEEINQAYKDLVFIWHPDRIPKDNARLQQKAQDKLKQLNQARDHLRTAKRDGRNRFSSFRRSNYSRTSSSRQSNTRSSEAASPASKPPREGRSPSYASSRSRQSTTRQSNPKRYGYQP
ncbi:MAG: J domain-containing protein, partial [Cyanobacteria bacterium J06626_14]